MTNAHCCKLQTIIYFHNMDLVLRQAVPSRVEEMTMEELLDFVDPQVRNAAYSLCILRWADLMIFLVKLCM